MGSCSEQNRTCYIPCVMLYSICHVMLYNICYIMLYNMSWQWSNGAVAHGKEGVPHHITHVI